MYPDLASMHGIITHMGCGHVCDCENYRAHVATVSYAASAMPTRKGVVAGQNDAERSIAKDRDAYKRLKDEGLHPRACIGAAEIEATSENRYQVEQSARFVGKESKITEIAEAAAAGGTL